jgi:hypothetical protein
LGQEFFVKSKTLEDKVRQVLPSQGGLGAGFDLSASTQIIPIVDLTESAEGSTLRADLQSALSFNTITNFTVVNATTDIITNTGFYRVFGILNHTIGNPTANGFFRFDDGATQKIFWYSQPNSSSITGFVQSQFDFNVFIGAGEKLTCVSSSADCLFVGATRQLATINQELVNPQ